MRLKSIWEPLGLKAELPRMNAGAPTIALFPTSVLSLKFLEQFEESKMFQKLLSGAEAHLVLQCLRHD